MQVPGIVALLLMHVEEFQSGTVRIEVTQMDGISMTETNGIKYLSVIVESCRAPDDLVFSVTVNITDGKVVVTIGIHRITTQSGGTHLRRKRLRLAVGLHHAVAGLLV